MEQFFGNQVTEVVGLPLNAPLPMEVTVLGMVMSVSLQFKNARAPIVVRPSCNDTLANLVQP